MKRGFVIISIFVLLLGLCIFEEIYLKNNLTTLYDKTNEIITLTETSENVNSFEISNKISELKDFWDKTEGYFCLVVNHINMEEAGEQIAKIETLCSQNKKDELVVELNLLLYYAKSYEHIIVPHIQNIL